MNGSLLRFEWRYQTRRVTYAATVVLLILVPLALVGTHFGPESDAINGPFIITESVALLSLLSVFALPMLCVHAALRDHEYGMRDLIVVKPTPYRTVLGVRFAGVLLAALLALAIATAVLAVAPGVLPVPTERLSPFSAAPYWRAFTILALPNVLWCSAVLFVVAAVSRSTMATFVASIAIYAGYMVTALMVDSPLMAGTRPATPELMARVALLDPFGLSAFFEQTQFLTPQQRAHFTLPLQGRLLINRVGVLAVAVICAVVGLLANSAGRSRSTPGTNAERSRRAPAEAAPAFVARLPQLGTPHWVAALRSVLRIETTLFLKAWPLRVLVVLWVAIVAIEADGQLKSGEYATRVLASTAQVADAVPMALQLLGTLAVLYFATELFTRERLVRFAGVRDATPVPSAVLLTGKLLALATVPVLFALTGYGTTVLWHWRSGGLPIEWGVLGMHVLVSLVPLFITTALAAALQVIIGQRYVALLAGVVIVMVSSQGQSLGLEHPLLRFGAAPPVTWSDLNGFGSTLTSWWAFQGVWALVTLLLLGIGATLFTRGEEEPLWPRLRRWPAHWRAAHSPVGRVAFSSLTLLCALSYFGLYWHTTRRHVFPAASTLIAERADYERQYRRLAHLPQPSLVHVALDVELYPTEQRANVHEVLQLVNRTASTIDTVWLSLPRDAQGDAAWRLPRSTPAAVSAHDERLNVLRLALHTPLAPGDSAHITLELALHRGGIRALPSDIDLSANGTMLHSTALLPEVGYVPRREVQDSTERVALGLPAATPAVAPLEQADALADHIRRVGRSPAWFTSAVHITTDSDQMALGPGVLTGRSVLPNARVRYQYRTPHPTTPYFAIVSGRYEVQRAVVTTDSGTIPVEVWHTPQHEAPAKRLLQVSTQSLSSLSAHFGHYPHPALRVVEVQAGHRFGAYALPGTVYLTETRGMLSDARAGDVDLLLRRIGHEVAHQWWGHAVSPLDVEGRLLLVESVAKYAEQVMVAKLLGEQAVADMLRFDRERYLRGRQDTERSLERMDDDPRLYYAKGALAFQALRHALGENVVRDVLRDVLRDHSGERGTATSRDLLARLRTAALRDDQRRVIDDWFTGQGLPDPRPFSASAWP